jgi:hypothetical protein
MWMTPAKPPRRRRWYLLIHQVPPKPLYLRAKIRQRLWRVGAVALKNSVYVLPRREDCLEDFQWIAEEAVSGGGEAHICEASFPGSRIDGELVERFQSQRDAEYRDLARSLAALRKTSGDLPERLARARKRFEEILKIDFFSSRAGKEAEMKLRQIERRNAPSQRGRAGPGPARRRLAGRTWVTRRGVKVDRIASAWLIRRFLDTRAKFRFVDPSDPPHPGELRFDMVGGDFTHEGGRCTFETLIARNGIRDRALACLAEIVHDIDIKDSKFGRPETPGLERILAGLLSANPEDKRRLTGGFGLFDSLYESFRAGKKPRRRPKA